MSGAFVIFIPLPLTPSRSLYCSRLRQEAPTSNNLSSIPLLAGRGQGYRPDTSRARGKRDGSHIVVLRSRSPSRFCVVCSNAAQAFLCLCLGCVLCRAPSSCDQLSVCTIRTKERKTNRLAIRGLRSLALLPRFRRAGNRLFLRNRRLVRLPALAYRFVSVSADVNLFLCECPGNCKNTGSRARPRGKGKG